MTLPQWMRDGRDPTDAEWDAYQAMSFRRSIQREVYDGLPGLQERGGKYATDDPPFSGRRMK